MFLKFVISRSSTVENLYHPPCGFNFGDRGLAEPMRLDMDRPRQRAFCQDLDLGPPPAHEAGLREDLRCHILDAFEPVQVAEVHDSPLLREDVREPALGHAPGQGHLPPLEPGTLAASRAGFLSLVAPRGRLAVSGADTSANPLAPPSRPWGWFQVMRSEEHTSELQSLAYLVCRLLLEKKKHSQHKHLV